MLPNEMGTEWHFLGQDRQLKGQGSDASGPPVGSLVNGLVTADVKE